MVLYFFIGFGIPLVMSATVIAIQTWKPFDTLPDIGTQQCFLTVKSAQVNPEVVLISQESGRGKDIVYIHCY